MKEADAYTRLAGVYDEIVVDPCYPFWADFLNGLWQGDASGVHSVLDVCCGTGLMAAELVSRGYRVVGTDASTAMLDRAHRLLGPSVRLLNASLPDIGTTETFDAAVSTFDGLNYLAPLDFQASLASVAQHLRPHGWFIFDLHTDAMMRFTAANPIVAGDADGNEFLIRSEVDLTSRTCETSIEISAPREGDPFIEWHRQYFHSAEQVRNGLAAAGFTRVFVTDEYTLEPEGPETLRATWVARLGGGCIERCD